MNSHLVSFTTAALLATAPAAAQQTPDLAPYLMPDRAAEVALARSAAPRQVSDSATVLVLTRTGFVQAANGSNGFTCLVLRSFNGSLTDPNFWAPKVRAPNCLNAPAARTVLPGMLKRVEWIMSGASKAEIGARTQRAYATHEFVMPETGAMTYMLSPMQILSETDPHWMPHLMFFYDGSIPVATWGAGDGNGPIIDGSGVAKTPVRTLLIPVRQWSDGTAAPSH